MKTTVEPIDIQPNKASWILGNGRVVDVAVEGLNSDASAFSHGMFVKKWIRFRAQNFFPGKEEVELAKAMERRTKQLLADNPDLKSDDE